MQLLRQIFRKRPAQTVVTQYDIRHFAAFDVWRNTAARDFHFWQFRHDLHNS
jgi:hypothetical protein